MSGIASHISHLVLGTYYCCAWPHRCRRNAAAARAGRAPAMILFYHRVADHTPNGWSMSTATFERQIRWLSRHFDLISLEQTQRRMEAGWNDRPSVAITFDDGYAENCTTALPLLVELKIPVTYFVASRYILEERPFPHDVAAGRPLPTNTVDQLRQFVKAGVEIGAHTRTHADLGATCSSDALYDEVVGCREELEEALQTPVSYFSFPYGLPQHLSSEAFSMARHAGYAGVCSAYGGYNFPGDHAFHLQRIHADPEMVRLKNWLTVDPRKVGMVRQYRAGYESIPELTGVG